MWWPFGASDASPRASSQPTDAASVAPPPKIPEPIKRELSSEEQASLDFEQLLREIEVEQASSKDGKLTKSAVPLSQTVPVPEDISPDSLYPTELACRSALDYAMFCQSFGGQFVNVYRYGEFRSCSNHWSDFWLCMRTRNWDPKDRAMAIKDHYRKKAIKYKTGPSSEDIWSVRSHPVKDAFQESLEDLEAKIEEWKQTNPGVPDPWANSGKPAGTVSTSVT